MRLTLSTLFFTGLCLVYPSMPFYLGKTTGGYFRPPKTWKPTRDYEDQWFTQKLDHFNESDTRSWQQRYFVDDRFFNSKLRYVVYLFVSGESDMIPYWMEEGNWLTTANDSGALLFQLEHRYYGKSTPLEDMSTENLKYLNSQQALADIAAFIKGMNKQYELLPIVRWILFGGSYAGLLVTWFRELYPELSVGAVASSAPLAVRMEFKEYLQVVADDLKQQSQECVDRVQQGTTELQEALDNLGSVDLNKLFNLCQPIEEAVSDPKNIAGLFSVITSDYMGIAQYNNFNHPMHLGKVCDIILQNSSSLTALESLSRFSEAMHGSQCLDYTYDNLLKSMAEGVTSEFGVGIRQWTYQACTEFGYFVTSSGEPHVFGDKFPLDFYTGICTDVFGPEFGEARVAAGVNRTLELYGGVDVDIDNIYYFNGGLDPYHLLGKLDSDNVNSPAAFLANESHGADMTTPNEETDSRWLLAIKQLESASVLIWTIPLP